MRETGGVDVTAALRSLAARVWEPLAPPGPDPDPDPVAPCPLSVDTPRELEESFKRGFPESVDAEGLDVPLFSSGFLLKEWSVSEGRTMYGVICAFLESELR